MSAVNAKIRATMLGIEGHGILSAYLSLDFGGCSQSFGGYALDAPPAERKAGLERRGTAWGMEFVARVMRTVGVEKWEDLPGKYVRIERSDGWNGTIIRIGHITEDKWFDPKKDMEDFQ